MTFLALLGSLKHYKTTKTKGLVMDVNTYVSSEGSTYESCPGSKVMGPPAPPAMSGTLVY